MELSYIFSKKDFSYISGNGAFFYFSNISGNGTVQP